MAGLVEGFDAAHASTSSLRGHVASIDRVLSSSENGCYTSRPGSLLNVPRNVDLQMLDIVATDLHGVISKLGRI